MTTTPQHKLLALADRLALIPAITDWADDSLDAVERELRALAATLPPAHSVDANKMVAADNGQGLRADIQAVIDRISSDRASNRFWVESRLREILATHPPQQERAAVPDGWVLVLRLNLEALRKDFANDYCRKSPTFDAWLNSIECMLAAAPAAPATPDPGEGWSHALSPEHLPKGVWCEVMTVRRSGEMKSFVRIAGEAGADGEKLIEGKDCEFLQYRAFNRATPESAEPVAWMVCNEETGEVYWDGRECVWNTAADAEEAATEACWIGPRYKAFPLYTHPTPAASDGAEDLASFRAAYAYVMQRYPWSESNDMLPGDELVVGIEAAISNAAASDGGLREALHFLARQWDREVESLTSTGFAISGDLAQQHAKELRDILATPPTEQAKLSESPTVDEASRLLVSALQRSKGWLRDYAEAVVREAIDREPVAAPAQVTDAALEACCKVVRDLSSDVRHSIDVDGYTEPQRRFLASIAGRIESAALLGGAVAMRAAQPDAGGVVVDEAMALDAARWRALFMGRVRVLGSAGLHEPTDFNGDDWDGYAHVGVELWTKHPEYDDAVAREWFTRYADTAIAALAGQQKGDGR